MGGSSCRKEKDLNLLGSYSGKFPIGVLFTGCFLKRQALSSPVTRAETKATGREVTQPRSQSWKVVDRAVSTTVKSAACSCCGHPLLNQDHPGITLAQRLLGADLQHFPAFLQQIFTVCSQVPGTVWGRRE